MAITSISRIQHRRGLNTELPSLASAELGWSINDRRLYIGNGTIAEGAPELGNTEILTQYSNIMALLDTYTYQGSRAGYIANTSNTVRTFQEKLDEYVSVLDFGAVGDSITDDTDAINLALYELYSRELNTEVRRILTFPAGIFKVTGVIKIPTYAHLVGAGIDKTIILQTDGAEASVFKLADNLQQIDASQGTGTGSVTSAYIGIEGITFKTSADIHVGIMNFAKQVVFHRVKFQGPKSLDADINTSGSNKACILFNSPTDGGSYNVQFNNCEFSDHSFGAKINGTVRNIKFNNCYFYHIYQGLSIGQSDSGTATPRSISVTSSLFDKVYSQAILGYEAQTLVSSFNSYLDVGNGLVGEYTSVPAYSVLEFASSGNTSFADYFSRTDTANLVYARVNFGDYNNYQVTPDRFIKYAYMHTAPGGKATLTDNTAVATSSGITFSTSDFGGAEVDYTITRGTSIRTGKLKIVHNATAQMFDDEYSENASTGVKLTVSYSSGTTTLKYTTTNTGSNATIKYQTRYLN
jgi:hypothetical protein